MSFTIGSLFDGSGGFPLAASLCGGTPKWASEIEPYPIAVTKSRFPGVKHLGSVTDIKGGEVDPVDVITFGSPCQDLSVAGKRAGLKHEANGDDETTRSGLFMEAVRIIKEMRLATNGVYPRFALWENVPGAFSSNKGEDFRIVLEELIKIVEPTAVMPAVPKNGWPYADSYCGDGWSIAYRVLDAQFWGVPQRRRRIYLILDLRGKCARKISFERDGLRGYFETGRTPWQTVTGEAENGPGTANCEGGHIYEGVSGTLRANAGDNQMSVAYTLKIRSGCEGGGKGALIQEDMSATLATNNDQYLFQPVGIVDSIGGQAERGWVGEIAPTLKASHYKFAPCVAVPTAGFCTEHSAQARGIGYQEECAPTLRAGVTPALVYSIENNPADSRVNLDESGKVQTLTSRMGTGGGNVPMVCECTPIHDQATRFSGKRGDKSDGKGNGLGVGNPGDPMNTLTSGDRHVIAYSLEVFHCTSEEEKTTTIKARDYKDPGIVCYGVDCRNATEYPETMGAIQAAMNHNLNSNGVVRIKYIVRRLTPTECARLQGFPDTWGHPDEKTEFTDEEYQFWLNVRNTHAAINEKTVKDYSKDQILKWYNSLHTDSSEYKMWGNGIALPNALYVMQGIADVMTEEKVARRKWLKDLLGDCV